MANHTRTGVAIRKEDEGAEAGVEDVAVTEDEVEDGDTIVFPTRRPSTSRADTAVVYQE